MQLTIFLYYYELSRFVSRFGTSHLPQFTNKSNQNTCSEIAVHRFERILASICWLIFHIYSPLGGLFTWHLRYDQSRDFVQDDFIENAFNYFRIKNEQNIDENRIGIEYLTRFADIQKHPNPKRTATCHFNLDCILLRQCHLFIQYW